MKIAHRTTLSIVLAIPICIYSLYFLGNLGWIVAYDHSFFIPTIKLAVLHLIFFGSMLFCSTSLIDQFLKFKLVPNIVILLLTILLGVIALFSHPTWVYIPTGSYLRDYHGINWFHMDWGGWLQTMTLYCTPIFAYIFYKIIEYTIFKKLSKKYIL
jgi:hypothetical protein